MAEERESGGPGSLRIALVCPYSLSRPGGVQGQVLGLARSLGRRAHRATIFAPLDDRADVPPGADVVPTGRPVSLPANGSVAAVSLSVPAVARSLRSLRSAGFDLVHVHEPFAPGLPYGLLVGRGLPPLVATFHRSGGSALYTVFRPLARRLARRFDLRCAVSDAARSTASQALGGTYEVCFNGVELDSFRAVEPWPTEHPTLLFLGRHEERKGLGVLLDAFVRLRAGPIGGDVPRAVRPVLWIAGHGPETATLRRRYPQSADIRWLGVLSEEEKVRRLVGARVLCAPSLRGESFGMVLLEGMAARTVVVASDIDGYRDAAGGHAVMVPPGDARALAEALARVVGSGPAGGVGPEMPTGAEPNAGPADDGSWPDAAAAWASHWSMDRLAGWYEERYRSVVAGPAR
ncbi:MAG: glycosyltransferase family 4 protein [Acidimicrobiales bacterium]